MLVYDIYDDYYVHSKIDIRIHIANFYLITMYKPKNSQSINHI